MNNRAVVFFCVFCFFIGNIAYSTSNYCEFVGTSAAQALSYTANLISDLESLKNKEGREVSDRSLESLANVQKYFIQHTTNQSLYKDSLIYQENLNRYTLAYTLAASTEKDFWLSMMLLEQFQILRLIFQTMSIVLMGRYLRPAQSFQEL